MVITIISYPRLRVAFPTARTASNNSYRTLLRTIVVVCSGAIVTYINVVLVIFMLSVKLGLTAFIKNKLNHSE